MIDTLVSHLHPIAQGAFTAMIFASSFFAYKRLDPDNPQAFNAWKWGTTVGFGGVFGAVLTALGIAPTPDTIGSMLMVYGGPIIISEAALKALLNGEKRLARKKGRRAMNEIVRTTLSLGLSRDSITKSIKRESEEYGELSEEEQQEEWDRDYPDRDTWAQEDEGEGEPIEEKLPPA